MKILIACEYSGVVRDAFQEINKEDTVVSCDILPSSSVRGTHLQCDIRTILYDRDWDLMIAHPPCTHLAVSGARWFKDKVEEQKEALAFVQLLLDAPIKHIALENPVSIISSRIRKPNQYIQPWQHGHGETKKTGLWLKNLPLLEPTDVVSGREPRIHKMAPGPDRWKKRSVTYKGIASAMASQWSLVIRG